MKNLCYFFMLLALLFQSCKVGKDCCPEARHERGGTSSGSETALQRSQCDVYIDLDKTSVRELRDYFVLETEIRNHNDDDANYVEVLINMPVESEFSSISAHMKSGTTSSPVDCQQCGHLIKCKPRRARIGDSDVIEITAKIGKPRFDNIVPAIGVTAYSHFPTDPVPSNNTFYWRGE